MNTDRHWRTDDERSQKATQESRLRNLAVIILSVTLILGTAFCVFGGYKWYSSSGSSYDHLAATGTSVILGWDPYDSSADHPNIYIGVEPFLNGTITSALIINILGTIYTNKTFTFGFISPFIISSVEWERGNWSYQNVSDLGSIIYYTYRLNSSLRSGFLSGSSVFYFTNLPARNDHGSYTVFIPFGTLLSSQFHMTHFFTFNRDQEFSFRLDIPLTYIVTSSYPPFSSTTAAGNSSSQTPLQSLLYNLNGTAGLSVTYEDSEAVDNFAVSQNQELFSLGLGVPLLLSSLLEVARRRC